MDENIKAPLKQLSEALQRAIADSSDVEDALRVLRTEGFAAHLVLEVTIAISRADDAGSADEDDEAETDDADDDLPPEGEDEPEAAPDAPPLTATDAEFLRSLRIRLDD